MSICPRNRNPGAAYKNGEKTLGCFLIGKELEVLILDHKVSKS